MRRQCRYNFASDFLLTYITYSSNYVLFLHQPFRTNYSASKCKLFHVVAYFPTNHISMQSDYIIALYQCSWPS